MSRLHDLRRAMSFARHIPLSKLARRAELATKRRLRDRLPGRSPPANAPPRAGTPSLPLFAPREALTPVRDGDGWTFRFLNRAIVMQGMGVDWRAPGPGAASQLWRMNLHYMEYLEGCDDDAFCALVEDWLAANAAKRPGDWRDSWNSYALSLRVVVWMAEMARRGGHFPRDLQTRMSASLAGQIRFLLRDLETDLGGNHLIKNIKALLWASAFFDGEAAARWREVALTHLARELDRQILDDGVHYERSPAYHNQVFADLIECRHVLGCDPLGGKLESVLRRMAQASADLAHPDGGIALFNDAGLAMSYAPEACGAAFARVFGTRPLAANVFAYPHAGYFGARIGGMYFIVDCGRIAPDDLPAHGHGDVLSFEWSVAGERVIVDPGVFEYVAGERRQVARSARSHNTLCLDGADQADFFGAFRCGRRPDVEVRRWEGRDDGFLLEGAHDGFAHLPGRPCHVRRVEVAAGRVDILDRIEGRTNRGGQIAFLLAPAAHVSGSGQHFEIAAGAARIRLDTSLDFAAEPAVWWPDLGVEIPTTRLVGRFGPSTPEVRTRFTVL